MTPCNLVAPAANGRESAALLKRGGKGTMPEPRSVSRPTPRLPARDFALEVYFSRWQKQARHHLTASDSETLTVGELLALADPGDREAWGNLPLGYSDPRGAERLRRAIAAFYAEATPETVLCFAGAQEAIHIAMEALLRPEDHAVVVLPNYQSAETIPAGLCAVSGVALDPARGWTLDIDAVAAALRANTRVIAINFPNNPTGKILERDRFDALVALCRRHGLWLFSDEVYRLIERDPARRLPAAVDAYERGLSLGGLSKSFGLPGLRIGWIACRDAALLQRMERIRHYLSICNPPPSEMLAAIALEQGERILARNRRIAADNVDLLRDFFDAHAELFHWYLPDGGVVGFPRYRGAEGVDRFCARLIEGHGVLLLPGSVYRSDLAGIPADRFRIGFGRADLAPGLEALGAALHGSRLCV
jgi:aspartate/methionine/tyrosine aminotransferase